MAYETLREGVQALVDEGATLGEIESMIGVVEDDEEERSALWLLAWHGVAERPAMPAERALHVVAG